jgi:hypothetical protein
VTTENLGRVIDLEKGIFKNRLKGIFHFDFESGYSIIEPSNRKNNIKNEITEQSLVFGNIYAAYKLLKSCGFINLFKSIYPNNEDSLLTMVLFRLLTDESYVNTFTWWNNSYARLLFPNASVQSQRISEHLVALGKQNLQSFFQDYLKIICKKDDICGIIIDSTGVPNDINIDLTIINNHNGIINNEIRLIYVIDRIKKTPIYFRVVAGNIVDVLTLQNTINEIKSYNLGIKYVVLDAGYYSEDNIKFLFSNNISFVTRLIPNRLIAKDLIGKHFSEIIHMSNHIIHNGRLLFVKKFEVPLFGHKAYAYIAVDSNKRQEQLITLVNNNSDKNVKNRLTNQELEIESKLLGTFILLSSIDLDVSEILPYYSSRNYIEQIFDVTKNNALLNPIRVHTVDGLMGHVLINFLTVITYMKLNSHFDNTKYCAKNVLYELSFLMGKLLNQKLFIYEPNKSIKKFFKLLNISIPKIIDLSANTCINNDYFVF